MGFLVVLGIVVAIIIFRKSKKKSRQDVEDSVPSQTNHNDGQSRRKVHRTLPDYVVLDTETTGLDTRYAKIVELSMIRVRNHKITDTYSQMFNPGKHIPESATAVNGITDEMVKGKPLISACKDEIRRFIGSDYIVGHNLPFDVKFVNKELGEEVLKSNLQFDTLSMAKSFDPSMNSYKLVSLCRRYKIADNQDHRALSDCILTHKLLEYMLSHCSEFSFEA